MGAYAFLYQARAAGSVIPLRVALAFRFVLGALAAVNARVLAWVMSCGIKRE
jgi:hypothetical protein